MNNCNCMCEKLRELRDMIINKRIRGIQVSCTEHPSLILDDGDTLPFDTIDNNLSNFIAFDSTTGVFTVKKSGIYTVQYYVNVGGTSATTNVKFAVNGIESEASSNSEGQMSGFALLSLGNGAIISLTNESGQQVLLGKDSIQAGIMITTI